MSRLSFGAYLVFPIMAALINDGAGMPLSVEYTEMAF
jgi:hypothetical protein